MVMNLKTLFVKYIKLREKLSKAKIYKIVDNTNDNKYIGSTCKTLKTRLTGHKCNYKRFLKGLCGNVKSFDIIRNRDYKIELLENCDIKTKQELLARERFYIENNECLNKYIPGRYDNGYQQYQKEYREANKDKAKNKAKEYYNDNKDKLDNFHKAYNETNKEKLKEKFICVCGGNYTHSQKSTHIKTNKHQKFLESQNK